LADPAVTPSVPSFSSSTAFVGSTERIMRRRGRWAMTTATNGQVSTRPEETNRFVDEPRGHRLARHVRRARLYAWAFVSIALLVVLVALVATNTRSVQLDWVLGSTRASLIWVIFAAALLGWLFGIATSILFRYRTRRPSVHATTRREAL
jgi:uncharacterized integral membrane protein